MLKREWTKDEDTQLCEAVEVLGESDWQSVASTLEGRTGTNVLIGQKSYRLLEFLFIFKENYTLSSKLYSIYTLHPKLFECMFCTLNYDICYTLHSYVKFSINLDENLKFRIQSVIKNIVH